MFSSCLVFGAEQVVEGRGAFRAAAAANNSTMRTVRMTQSGEVAAGQPHLTLSRCVHADTRVIKY